MKLLVTGASGLLGTKLCELALKEKHEVLALYSQHKPIYGKPLKVDITNHKTLNKIFLNTEPEAIIHAAALVNLDLCEKEKELAWRTNVEATATIAELSTKYNAFLIYISTESVFNGKKGNYKETDKPNPINYYGLTKLKAEQIVRESKTKHCIARTSVIYGATLATGKTHFALWLLHKLKKREEAKVVTDQWNSPTLNTNLSQMILEILKEKTTGTFHLAGATRISRYEFAKDLAQTFNFDPNLIRPVSSKEIQWFARRPEDSSLNVEKATRTFRHRPMPIHEALTMLRKEIKQP